MNQTHIHLLINHLPIFGSILGAIVLGYGLWTKSNPTKNAGYILFIISAVGGGIAYLTGEAAEESIENIQDIGKNMIDLHEDFAVFAIASLIILGITSIAGLFLTMKQSSFTRTIAIVILFISLISFSLAARTGYLGGQIRHTEINNSNTTTQGESGESDEND